MKKKRISTIIAVVLLVTLLSGLVAIPGSASTVSYPPEGRVADPETDARLTTPPPLNYGEQMGFIDIPRVHDGRIWTDKTVRTGSDVDDFDITLSALSQSFPINSGYAIPTDTVFVIDVSGSMTYIDPPNTRRRIDMLIEALNGAIEILQDAHPLNRIAVVAYGGGPDQSGLARVENLLPLERYVTASGSNEYFSYIPNPPAGTQQYLRVNVGSNPRGIRVNASTPTQWGIYEGAMVLQREPLITATVPRTDNNGTFIENITVTRRPNIVLMTDGEPTLGWSNYLFTDPSPPPVQPNPVTPGPDGGLVYSPTPTYAPPGTFYGDGSWGEMGVSILTVLTAAHRKREVLRSYFGSGANVGDPSPGYAGQPTASVGFFSIAFGTQPAGNAGPLILATMNPGSSAAASPNVENTNAINWNVRSNMSDLSLTNTTFRQNPWDPAAGSSVNADLAANGAGGNMKALLDRFIAGDPISFNVSRRQSFGSYIWDQPPLTISNTQNLTLAEIDFATMFETADNLDDLNEAFRKITTYIQMQGIEKIVTVTDLDEDSFDGYLSFSDVLGEYMQVRSVGGLTYNNVNFSRAGFASAIANDATQRSQYVNILWHHMNYGTPTNSPLWLSESTVANLVATNIANPNFLRDNSLKYYANTNRDFVGSFFQLDGTPAPQPAGAAAVVEVFPMWGSLVGSADTPLPPSGQTDLRLITFHVITALRNTSFAELYATNNAGDPMMRVLNEGDQMIRWYIPSDLIPIRTPMFNADGSLDYVDGNIHPIRVNFTVGLDRDRVSGDIPPDVFSQYQVPGTTDQMWFYSNRNSPNPTNVTLAFFRPHSDNPFYQGVGSTDRRAVIKSDNLTDTAPHVNLNRVVAYSGSSGYDMHWLGNNGRLTFRLTNPPVPGDLTLSKTFTGIPSDMDVFDTNIVSQISFLVVGTNAAGSEIYRETVLFNSTNFRWNDTLRRYECALQNLPLGNYRIYERGGNILDYVVNRPGPPQLVSITSTGQSVSVSFVNNYTHTPVPPEDWPALTVWKVFHGLANAQIPAGFQIRITGPGEFSQTINRDQAIAGATFRRLTPGQYTVTEEGNTVPGFEMTVTIDGQSRTLPYTFTIESSTQHIGMNIDNYYEPATPPSPQTGLRGFTLPVVILLLGAVIIGMAEGYRRRGKKKD
jgi:hypothetical protein